MDQIISTEWGSARALETLFFHSLNEPCEHTLNLTDAGVKSLLLFLREEAQVASEQQKVFKFAGRPERRVKELSKLRAACPAAAFGNVRGYGRCRASHLARQTVPLRFRKGGCRRVDSQRQRMASLPDLQLSVILHCLDNQLSIFRSYLQPKTSNRSQQVALTGISHDVNSQPKPLFSYGKLKTDNCQPVRGTPC